MEKQEKYRTADEQLRKAVQIFQAAKQEKENLRHMLAITHNKDYTFPDGSIFKAAEAKNRIKELTYRIIPQFYKEQTESRYNHLSELVRI
jgi:hypothetical protein